MEEEGLTPPLLRNRNVNWGRLQESLNSDYVLPTALSIPTWLHDSLADDDDEDDDDALSFVVRNPNESLRWVNNWLRPPGSIIPFDVTEVSLADRASAMERYAQDVRNEELRFRSARDLIAQRDLLGLRNYIAEPVHTTIRWEHLQAIKDCFIHRQPFEYDIHLIEMHPIGRTRHATVHVEVRTTSGDNCTQILLDGNPIIYWTASPVSTPYLREGYPITVEYNYLKMEKYYLDLFMSICNHLNLTMYLFRDGITLSRWPESEQRIDPFLEDYLAGEYRTYFMSDRVVRDYIYEEIRNERRRRAPKKG